MRCIVGVAIPRCYCTQASCRLILLSGLGVQPLTIILEGEMRILSLSEAKMKLSALVDAVMTTDEEVTITKNGRPVAVLVSPDEFESWRETITVMSESDLMDEIKEGLDSLQRKKAKLYTLEELFT